MRTFVASVRSVVSSLLLIIALVSPAAYAEKKHVAPVNINTASAETLASALDGVGLSKAEAIVAYRKQHGSFKNPAELSNVKGIGSSTVAKNKARIAIK